MDIDYLRQWIGREEKSEDLITPRVVEKFYATMNQPEYKINDGAPAPQAIHWCLAPHSIPMDGLGEDGHPTRGGFLPPIPLQRRMWAGGRLWFSDDLRLGDHVERRSRIEKIEVKKGRTGVLAFVMVSHVITTSRGLALHEEQNIVYRDHEVPGAARPTPPAQPILFQQADMKEKIEPTPILLFRYSAITFNSHRIHYDRNYARDKENYTGLVVQGPLQATLLLRLAAKLKDGSPSQFTFRSVKPLFDDAHFTIAGRKIDDGINLWVENAQGERTMTAAAQ